MTKYKLEYIWLDGYTPTPNLRGKTQIKEFASFPTLDQLPLWGFDGSSTMQAEGHSSDCVLKPVAVYPDGGRSNGVLVMCEVMLPDGKTPHDAFSMLISAARRLARSFESISFTGTAPNRGSPVNFAMSAYASFLASIITCSAAAELCP